MGGKIPCLHLLTRIAWGQVLPVSAQGLAEDVVREEKLQLAAGKAERRCTGSGVGGGVHNKGF